MLKKLILSGIVAYIMISCGGCSQNEQLTTAPDQPKIIASESPAESYTGKCVKSELFLSHSKLAMGFCYDTTGKKFVSMSVICRDDTCPTIYSHWVLKIFTKNGEMVDSFSQDVDNTSLRKDFIYIDIKTYCATITLSQSNGETTHDTFCKEE
jgi:hypothetical protein